MKKPAKSLRVLDNNALKTVAGGFEIPWWSGTPDWDSPGLFGKGGFFDKLKEKKAATVKTTGTVRTSNGGNNR
jgi:hypothetical protein